MKISLHWLSLVLLLTCTSLHAQTPTDNVKINPEIQYQSMEGWGSSLCWWANMVGKWDDAKIDAIVNLITAENKLNMNIFRYNIGGGDDPTHADGHMVTGKGKRAEMPGFKASAESAFDWTADAPQRKIMLKIKEKRPDAVFEAFSNSAPYWMTYSGCSAGNDPASADNLKPEYYEQFCDYLIEVCKHYKEVYGIEFKTLEPFNESTSSYWGYKGSQEGCHFDAASQIKVLRILASKLKASGLKTVISASDETSVGASINVLNAYKATPDIIDLIGQFNTHTYSGSNSERVQLRELVKTINKPFWQSETGPSSGSGLASNLGLAQKLFDDLRLMRPQAWIDWQLMEEWNDTWCLIRCNFASQEYNIIKNYYVRMQVTRFIKQGYKIIDTDHENVLAAINPAGTEMVAVLLNTSGSEKNFSLDLSLFGQRGDKAKVYRTSATSNCQSLDSVSLDGKTLNYRLADQSMVTLILPVVMAHYADYAVTKGITFEQGNDIQQFSGEGNTLIVKKNDQCEGLNNSAYALAVASKSGQTVTYTLEKPFYTSERARYFHVMMRLSDVTHQGEIDSQSLVWKDYVVDMGTDTKLTEITFGSSYDSCVIWLDNLCINAKKEERAITDVSPVFDFETVDGIPSYTLINQKDSAFSGQVIDNPDYAGLNAMGHLFQYALPRFSPFGSVNDTMRLHLDSPLRVTDNTRYLHVMVKSPATRIYFQFADWSVRKNILANKWVDVVVKMDSCMGQVLYDLAISPYSSSSGVTVYLDNICFNNDPLARTYADEIETNVPYLLISRNGGNVIEASGDQLMQSALDANYNTPAQQWIFVPSNGHYAIVSRQDDRLITDNGSYFLALSATPTNDNAQLFDIQWLGDGYAKIVSLSTGKAFDVQGSSSSPGAFIGLWEYGTSANIHRQWALHKVPGVTAIPTQAADVNEDIRFFAASGQLHVCARETLQLVEIYLPDGTLRTKVRPASDAVSIPLPDGLYILRVVTLTQEQSTKVVIKQ